MDRAPWSCRNETSRDLKRETSRYPISGNESAAGPVGPTVDVLLPLRTSALVGVRAQQLVRSAPGDRGPIWSAHCAEGLITQYAAAKAGAILVNINPAYRFRELEYAQRQSGASLLVAARAFRSTNYVAMLNELARARGQTLAQLAIAWVLRDPRMTSALVGASSVEQLRENLAAVRQLAFSAEELATIDRIASTG